VALSQVGRFDEASQAFERGRQLAAQGGDEVLLLGFTCFQTLNENNRGNVARALDYGRQAVDLAERVGSATTLVLAHSNYGRALVLEGSFDEAQRVLGRGLGYADEHGVRLLRPVTLCALADALAGLGRAEEAVARANEAIETSQVPSWTAIAHLSRAGALRLRDGLGSTPEIEADLASAAALVEEHGLRGMARAIHEERAQLAKLRGDEADFRAELGRARDLAAELGATGHLERLERELASA
jgi:tetratricopeptide (TPR) repeat protein